MPVHGNLWVHNRDAGRLEEALAFFHPEASRIFPEPQHKDF
jgi:hypothetical protein